jgi:hypothetical protein
MTLAAIPARSTTSLAQALEHSRALQDVLVKTEAEFNQLPIFVRPLARNGFKSKAGKTVQEWMRALKQLTDQLQAAGQDKGDGASLASICAQTHRELKRLQAYYAAVPAETARFTRDAGVLREVERLTQERLGVIDALDQSLGVEERQA